MLVRGMVAVLLAMVPVISFSDNITAGSAQTVAYAPQSGTGTVAAASEVLVLSAPPREGAAEGEKRFGPIAEYISKVIGRKVVYQHQGSWGVYQGAMQRGDFDLVFDGPHFNGWRVERLQHNVLVKLPGVFTYVGLVRADNARVRDLKDLAGRKICAHAPPNLGTLIMLDEFKNPSRQPVIIPTKGYKHIYEALLAGKCEGAMLPLSHLKEYDVDRKTRVVFQNKPLPEQALSAGPRIRPEEQERIIEALLSPEAEPALAKFGEAYGLGRGFVRANNKEYAGVAVYLKDMWGYY